MLKYKNNIINKLLNKLKEIKTGNFNTKVVYKVKVDEVVMRTKSLKLELYYTKTLYNEPIEIWNADQKIYAGLDDHIKVNLIDNTKDVIIKGNIINLACYENQLTTLNINKNINLQKLLCIRNELSTLNTDKNINLTSLDCHSNMLSSLNVDKNINLTDLACSNNKLLTLNVDKNINLMNLYCSDNQLTNLNIDKNINLTKLICNYNQLTLDNIIQLIKTIGKKKISKGICYLWGNKHRDPTQPPVLVEAIEIAKVNGWKIEIF